MHDRWATVFAAGRLFLLASAGLIASACARQTTGPVELDAAVAFDAIARDTQSGFDAPVERAVTIDVRLEDTRDAPVRDVSSADARDAARLDSSFDPASCIEGTHRCGATCVSNIAVATCLARCEPCPAVSHGVATCSETGCGARCETGFTLTRSGACRRDADTLPPTGNVAEGVARVAVVLSGTGQPHFIVQDRAGSLLWYSRQGASWVGTPVPAAVPVGDAGPSALAAYDAALRDAVGMDSIPLTVYFATDDGHVHQREWDGSAFIARELTTAEQSLGRPSRLRVVREALGDAVFVSGSNAAGSGVALFTVNRATVSGTFIPTIALTDFDGTIDSNQLAHLGYVSSDGSLRRALRTRIGWANELITPELVGARHARIALVADQPVIGFITVDGARMTAFDGLAWATIPMPVPASDGFVLSSVRRSPIVLGFAARTATLSLESARAEAGFVAASWPNADVGDFAIDSTTAHVALIDTATGQLSYHRVEVVD